MNYHIAENGTEFGPLSEDEIREQLAMGKIRSSAYVWKEGMAGWQPIGQEFPGIVRPPLPAPAVAAMLPVTAPAVDHFPRVATGERKYPKWPWIGFLLSCLLWGISAAAVGSIEQEALPLINEQTRMDTGEYVAGVGVEAFLRGALGDPFGKAGEEYRKANAIGDRLQQLSQDYQSAASAKSLFGWLVKISVVLWIWQHRKFKRYPGVAP